MFILARNLPITYLMQTHFGGGNANDMFRRLMLAQWLRNNDVEGMPSDSDEDGLEGRCSIM